MNNTKSFKLNIIFILVRQIKDLKVILNRRSLIPKNLFVKTLKMSEEKQDGKTIYHDPDDPELDDLLNGKII